jgi:hypothetical protein
LLIFSSDELERSLRTAPILQFPENIAPGSIDSLLVDISPCNFAVLLRESSSSTSIIPFNLPSKSAFLQLIFPSIFPVGPKTNLPFTVIVPFR